MTLISLHWECMSSHKSALPFLAPTDMEITKAHEKIEIGGGNRN